MKRKPALFTKIYLVLLFACAVWILLDQFVIPRELAPVQQAEAAISAEQTAVITEATVPPVETELISEAAAAASAQESEPDNTTEPTASVMETGAITEAPVLAAETEAPVSEPQITLSETRIFDTTVHIAEIRIPDASWLRTAIANDTYGRNIKQTVAEMAADKDALLAINGDYFGFRNSGYVIRNGVLYRDRIYDSDQEDLCIWPDGSMTVIRETEVSAQELMDQGVQDVLSFGPALVLNGEIRVSESLAIGPYSDDNPRTAIGMIEPLHYLFVVSDGRTDTDKGLTPYQLAELMRDMGAQLVYNLDGGGSSTMVYEGEIINFPTARGYWEERRVSDIVYIGR